MTPPPPFGSAGRSRLPTPARTSPGRGLASAGLVTALLFGISGACLTAQGTGPVGAGRLWGEVSRHSIPGGPESWVVELSAPGPVGVALVLPWGGGSARTRELARRIEGECPGESPVPGAGPDYEILSLAPPAGEVVSALECVGRIVAAQQHPSSVEVAGSPGSYSPDAEAYRSASGVLMANLYAPAPVPGGSLGGPDRRRYPRVVSHIVVVGSGDLRRVARLAETGMGGAWPPLPNGDDGSDAGAGGPSEPSEPVPRPPVSTEVLLLDRPGEVSAELRVGQLILPGTHPDWTALVVAREILADRLRGGPWAFAELLRVRGPGAFIAGSRLPSDATGAALDRLVAEVEGLRDRLLPPEEVDSATARLLAAFRDATATPIQVANELARVAALGLGPEAVLGYPERIATVTPETVRRAVREHLDPARFLIAAAGDGPVLTAALARFGPVRSVRPPPPPEDWPGLDFRGEVLVPRVSHYRVRVGGREVGTARREVVRLSGDTIWLRSSARVGESDLRQSMTATLPGFDFVEGTTTVGDDAIGSLRREGGRLVGTRPEGGRVDLPLPAGTVVSDLLEPALWASDLEPGSSYRVSVTSPDGGRVEWAAVQVVGQESVTVPAGTFETLRVEITGPELLTLWLRRESPHRTIRLLGGNGVVLELVGEEPPEGRDDVR